MQPHGAEAAVGRWRRQSPTLLKPRQAWQRVSSVAVAGEVPWGASVPPMGSAELKAVLVGLGAGWGVCLAWEKALAVRYGCVGRGSAGHGLCRVTVGDGMLS